MIITLKHRLSLNFVGVTLNVLELCRFTNGKIDDFLFDFMTKIKYHQKLFLVLFLNEHLV